jgi:Flp pilus assembly protein TadD
MDSSYAAAAENFSKVLELDPQRDQAVSELSFALAEEGKFAEALAQCHRFERLGMDNLQPTEAMVHVLAGEPQKAVDLIEHTEMDTDAGKLAAKYQLMLAYLEERNLQTAEREATDLRNQWSRNGQNSDIEYALGRILEAEGQGEKASEHLKKLHQEAVFDSVFIKEVQFVLSPKH